MSNSELAQQFYTAFAEMRAEDMVSMYHPEAQFTDPAFGTLHGEQIKNMWRMLIKSQEGKPFVVQHNGIKESHNGVELNWKAAYFFSKTSRRVLNKISANIEFKDGLIYRHTDSFNLYWWSCQALGIPGYLIGWTPFFKKKLQHQTKEMLKKFEASQPNA